MPGILFEAKMALPQHDLRQMSDDRKTSTTRTPSWGIKSLKSNPRLTNWSWQSRPFIVRRRLNLAYTTFLCPSSSPPLPPFLKCKIKTKPCLSRKFGHRTRPTASFKTSCKPLRRESGRRLCSLLTLSARAMNTSLFDQRRRPLVMTRLKDGVTLSVVNSRKSSWKQTTRQRRWKTTNCCKTNIADGRSRVSLGCQ